MNLNEAIMTNIFPKNLKILPMGKNNQNYNVQQTFI
jgi:hypothetical protein